jgi:uncharacterized coiled-coil DUF342 family protein
MARRIEHDNIWDMKADPHTDVLEIVNFIKDNMATRDDVGEVRGAINKIRADSSELRSDLNEFRVEVRGEFRELRREIADIIKRLDALETSVADIRGYAKELDGLRDRIRSIEKLVGITRTIAA